MAMSKEFNSMTSNEQTVHKGFTFVFGSISSRFARNLLTHKQAKLQQHYVTQVQPHVHQ